ncbi:MAG: hypothetical protein Ct9H300mP1_28700 [Planctomycetaceae bacterium]|nr:MAG: hypothetical protein Ct9H300mP1_28700 [Planctomycetaceae bacterium]
MVEAGTSTFTSISTGLKSLGLKPKYKVTSDQLWKGLLNIYRQVIPIVDGSKTKVAMHGNDPPLHNFVGSPQILCRHRDFDRLFSEVPSANNGITFCCGTRYESGEDVLKGIEHFWEEEATVPRSLPQRPRHVARQPRLFGGLRRRR